MVRLGNGDPWRANANRWKRVKQIREAGRRRAGYVQLADADAFRPFDRARLSDWTMLPGAATAQPPLERIEIRVEHRRHVEGDDLRERQAPDDGQSQRPP